MKCLMSVGGRESVKSLLLEELRQADLRIGLIIHHQDRLFCHHPVPRLRTMPYAASVCWTGDRADRLVELARIMPTMQRSTSGQTCGATYLGSDVSPPHIAVIMWSPMASRLTVAQTDPGTSTRRPMSWRRS